MQCFLQAAATFEAKASLLEKKLAPLREQLSTAEELRRKEASTFRETIDELSGANRGELSRMQAAYDAQMQDALDVAKLRAEEGSRAELEQLAAHFTSVESELTREVAEEKAAKESALKRANDLAANKESIQARVSIAERRVTELERTLADNSRESDGKCAKLEQALEVARSERKTKEGEFNELMDVKISLDEELKTYNMLLGREEARLGITPTQDRTKRRRITQGPMPYVSQLNLNDDCVAVKNAGDEPALLGGYTIKSVHSEDLVFVFPSEFELLPGASVTIWSGKKNQRRRRDPQTELWWSARYMWSDDGDMATLFDTTGAEVSKLEAAAGTVADAPDPTTDYEEPGEESEAAAGGERQCAIM